MCMSCAIPGLNAADEVRWNVPYWRGCMKMCISVSPTEAIGAREGSRGGLTISTRVENGRLECASAPSTMSRTPTTWWAKSLSDRVGMRSTSFAMNGPIRPSRSASGRSETGVEKITSGAPVARCRQAAISAVPNTKGEAPRAAPAAARR